jgi:glycosyltransferase involved in cell wall biosynthesis
VPGLFREHHGYWLARAIAPEIARLRRAGGIDLIDAHFGHPAGSGCVTIGRRFGLPVFVTLRGYEMHMEQHPAMRRRLGATLERAAGVIAVSRPLADLAVRLGAEPARVRLIPNGIDTSLFHPGDRKAARQALGIAADVHLILSIGYLSKRKRHEDVIAALGRLSRRAPRAELAILGGPSRVDPYRAGELESLAAHLGIGSRVHLVGAVEPTAVATWLQAADICTLPSSVAGCSNALIEALACGVPVVATPTGENPSFLGSPALGMLYGVGNVTALAEAIERLIRSAPDSRAISASVASRTWDRVATEIEDFFRRNFVKMDALLRAMRRHPRIASVLVHTGQHYDDQLSRALFEDLGIPAPDIQLAVGSASHATQTARIMERFEAVVEAQRPEVVLVVGDVNSTLACRWGSRSPTSRPAYVASTARCPRRSTASSPMRSATFSSSASRVGSSTWRRRASPARESSSPAT